MKLVRWNVCDVHSSITITFVKCWTFPVNMLFICDVFSIVHELILADLHVTDACPNHGYWCPGPLCHQIMNGPYIWSVRYLYLSNISGICLCWCIFHFIGLVYLTWIDYNWNNQMFKHIFCKFHLINRNRFVCYVKRCFEIVRSHL